MAMRLITYQARYTDNGKAIKEALKSYKDMKELGDSLYAIVTDETPKKVYSRLKHLIHEDDLLYVLNVTQPAAGTGPDKLNDWVKANLPGKK